jgi:preprotein translocase subunit SecG
MGTLISVIIVIVSILLILVVLVQNSKGGGLASTFSSSNQVMGVRKTADFLEKATWTLAIALLVLSILSTAYTKPSSGVTSNDGTGSKTKEIGSSKAGEAPAATNALPISTDSAK